MTEAAEIAEQKAILRGHMQEIRAEAAARDPDAADKLAARFPIKLFERYGPVVAGTLAIGDELDAAPLLARLAGKGARIVLPRVEASGTMTFRDAAPATLEKGPFGLTQPSERAEIVRPNLVLAPLLAFDARGRRLGYGKGYYAPRAGCSIWAFPMPSNRSTPCRSKPTTCCSTGWKRPSTPCHCSSAGRSRAKSGLIRSL